MVVQEYVKEINCRNNSKTQPFFHHHDVNYFQKILFHEISAKDFDLISNMVQNISFFHESHDLVLLDIFITHCKIKTSSCAYELIIYFIDVK